MIVIELTNELIAKMLLSHPKSAWFMNSKIATISAGSTSKKHTIPIVIAIGFWGAVMGTCGFDGGWFSEVTLEPLLVRTSGCIKANSTYRY